MMTTAYFSLRSASKDLLNAITNTTVSRRASMKVRVENFFRKATRIMWLAFAVIVQFVVLNLIFGACFECTKYAWVVVPLSLGNCGLWLERNIIMSIQTSWKNRQHVNHTTIDQADRAFSSKERTVGPEDRDKNGEQTSATMSQSSKSKSRSHGRKKQKQVKKKNMTIVQEADYEGTVVMTHIEGSNRYLNSRISMPNQNQLKEEEVAEDSAEAEAPSGMSTHQELSANTDD
jgi:hypothetical protein